MSTRYHLLTSGEAQLEFARRSVCISIIDESDPLTQVGTAALSNDWATFRTLYPLRPFYLFQVAGGGTPPPTPASGRLGIPQNLQTSIINEPLTRAFIRRQSGMYPLAGEAAYRFTAYDTTPDADELPDGVTRDNGNTALATDLFAIADLNLLQPGTNVFLFVDSSGSMSVANVRATLDLLRTRCQAAGISITSVFNGNENYILPFINFSGTIGVP